MHVFLSYVLSDWRDAVLCTEFVLRTGTGALSIQTNIIISGLVARRRDSFGSNKYLRKPECTVICIRSFTHLAHTHTHARTHARTHTCAHTTTTTTTTTIFYNYIFQTPTKQFSALYKARAGSRIGVGVDIYRHLHVLLDGEDLGYLHLTQLSHTPATPSLNSAPGWKRYAYICMTCRIGQRMVEKSMHMYVM